MAKKNERYFEFLTFDNEVITIRHNDYFKAEEIACRYHRIKEYIGWHE